MKMSEISVVLTCLCMFATFHALAADDDKKSSQKIKQASTKACAEISAEDATRLGLIKQMLTEGKPHAAIAHLDATHIQNQQAELLRADGLRQTGRIPQAQAIYEKLTNSCVSGYAYRGLGLIASNAGNATAAIEHLKTASSALPTEHTIRNDYGYVLMQSGQHEPALHEFLTAVELAPDYKQAAHNLILLLYQQGEIDKAAIFATRFGVGAEEMQQLKQLAAQHNKVLPEMAER